MQVETLAQGRNLVRHVLGPLLGRESPALGVEIKQNIAMQIPAVNHSPIIIYRLSFTINSYLCTVKLKL